MKGVEEYSRCGLWSPEFRRMGDSKLLYRGYTGLELLKECCICELIDCPEVHILQHFGINSDKMF